MGKLEREYAVTKLLAVKKILISKNL